MARIVIVDDNPEDIEWIADCLKSDQIQLCSTVDKAWAIITNQAEAIDLVVIDIMMPRGDLFKEQNFPDSQTGEHLYRKITAQRPQLKCCMYSIIARGNTGITDNVPHCRKIESPDKFIALIRKLLIVSDKL